MHFFCRPQVQIFFPKVNFFHASSPGAQCEVIEVLAEAGSQAVLPCKYNPSVPYPPAIIWKKANQG